MTSRWWGGDSSTSKHSTGSSAESPAAGPPHLFHARTARDLGRLGADLMKRYPAPAVAPASKFSIGWTRAHVGSQYSMLSAIAEDRSPEPNFADAVAVHAHIEAIYQAAASGGWVRVPKVERAEG